MPSCCRCRWCWARAAAPGAARDRRDFVLASAALRGARLRKADRADDGAAHALVGAGADRRDGLLAGTTSMAQSTASGSSAAERRHARPSTSPPAALIGKMRPAKPPLIRLWTTECPIFPGVRDAPMTATWRGANSAHNAARRCWSCSDCALLGGKAVHRSRRHGRACRGPRAQARGVPRPGHPRLYSVATTQRRGCPRQARA